MAIGKDVTVTVARISIPLYHLPTSDYSEMMDTAAAATR